MTEEQAIKVLCMIETHNSLAFKAKEIAIKNIKDMEEIKEIMECDADAETKCKMISYILTAKPHYFEEQKSYDDAISRKSLKHKLQENYDFFVNAYGGFNNLPQNDKARVDEITNCIAMVVNEPPVKPQEKTGHWILGICDNCGYDWGKDAPIASVPNFCPNCGVKMIEPQKRSE